MLHMNVPDTPSLLLRLYYSAHVQFFGFNFNALRNGQHAAAHKSLGVSVDNEYIGANLRSKCPLIGSA